MILHAAEAELTEVVRSIVGLSGRAAFDLLARPRPRPKVRRQVLAVIGDTIQKGIARALIRRSGGRRIRSLGADGSVRAKARIWEQSDPPQLVIGAASAHLLDHLLTADLDISEIPAAPPPRLSVGDEVFYYLAAERCLEAGFLSAMTSAPFGASALASLAFPVQIGPRAHGFDALLLGSGAQVVLALSPDLATKTRLAERARCACDGPASVLQATDALRQLPAAYALRAIERGRPDLGLFVLEGIATLLDAPHAADPTTWMPRAARTLTLAARQELAQGALVWLEVIDAYRRLLADARAVRFIDEDFERAQFLLDVLEPWSGVRATRTDSLRRALTSLETGTRSSDHARQP